LLSGCLLLLRFSGVLGSTLVAGYTAAVGVTSNSSRSWVRSNCGGRRLLLPLLLSGSLWRWLMGCCGRWRERSTVGGVDELQHGITHPCGRH
jgi:hypothetical protein